MNAMNHMNAPTTGSSQAAQLLSLLGGQATGGQAAAGAHGAAGKVGGGAFAALLQSLASGNGGAAGVNTNAQVNAGKGNGQAASPSLGALLSIYKGANGTDGEAANGGNPLKALIAALKDAGIDISSLKLPAGLVAQSGETVNANALTATANGETGKQGQTEDGTQNPLLALIALLASQTPAQAQTASTGQGDSQTSPTASASGTQAGEGAAESADAQLPFKGQAAQKVEDFLASLSPEDRARLTDTLRQLQARTPDAATQVPSAKAAAQSDGQATTTAQTNGDKIPLPQQASAQAHQQAQARPALPDQASEQAHAQIQAQAQARAGASGAGNATDADAAARAISQNMPEHLGRDVTVQVTQSHRHTATTGGPQLLSAGTSASVMAAGQGQGQTQGNAFAEAANAAVQAQAQASNAAQQVPQAHGVNTKGGESADTLFGLSSLADQDTSTDGQDGDAFANLLGSTSRPGSVDQLASSVVNIARTPMTQQAVPAQVAMHMSKAAEAGSNRFVIQLSPASLGDVQVDMKVHKDGTVHAMLHVEKPETLQMLQRDAGLLHQALQDAGLKPDGGSLNFSLRQDGGQFAGQDGNRSGPSHGNGTGLGDTDTNLADLAAQPTRRSHAGQLDVTI